MKYVYRGQKPTGLGPRNRSDLIYKIIIALLLVIIIALIIISYNHQKGFTDDKFSKTIISLSNSEMKQAITYAEKLSRSATSGTATTLARVRQHVHSLETLNSINILVMGQSARLYPQQLLDTTQGVLDSYFTQLQTGQPTNEILTILMKNLNSLSESTFALSIETK